MATPDEIGWLVHAVLVRLRHHGAAISVLQTHPGGRGRAAVAASRGIEAAGWSPGRGVATHGRPSPVPARAPRPDIVTAAVGTVAGVTAAALPVWPGCTGGRSVSGSVRGSAGEGSPFRLATGEGGPGALPTLSAAIDTTHVATPLPLPLPGTLSGRACGPTAPSPRPFVRTAFKSRAHGRQVLWIVVVQVI
ncbi:protein of unknown function [Cyanobium sp. NIES-981]|nr:protein of unknown function [Cyanobium sp. NIES-981]